MDSVNQQWNFWLAKEQQQKQPQNNTATHTNTTNTRFSVDAYLNCFILTNNIFSSGRRRTFRNAFCTKTTMLNQKGRKMGKRASAPNDRNT